MKKQTTAVILAAGSGLRMGLLENKVYLTLMGKHIVGFSIEAFAKHPQIREILLVTRADEVEKGKELLSGIPKESRVIVGGSSRQESVYKAMLEVNSKYVLIHDGARPLVTQEDITNCIQALKKYDGCVLAYPIKEPIYLCKAGKIRESIRENLYGAQTPQGFHTKILQACHQKHKGTSLATDDSSLLEREGYQVGIVLGDEKHCKVTLPMDLHAVKAQLTDRQG